MRKVEQPTQGSLLLHVILPGRKQPYVSKL
jgi:hypothetical protein